MSESAGTLPRTLVEGHSGTSRTRMCACGFVAALRWARWPRCCPAGAGSGEYSFPDGPRGCGKCKGVPRKQLQRSGSATIFEDSRRSALDLVGSPRDCGLSPTPRTAAPARPRVDGAGAQLRIITQKGSAWFLNHRIRAPPWQTGTFAKLDGVIEGSNETFHRWEGPGKARNMHKHVPRRQKITGQRAAGQGRRGRASWGERGGKIGAPTVVTDTKRAPPSRAASARRTSEDGRDRLLRRASNFLLGPGPTDYVHEVVDHAEKYVEGRKVHVKTAVEKLLGGCFKRRPARATYVSSGPVPPVPLTWTSRMFTSFNERET